MMLHIRNMESNRCISMVKNELNKLGLHYKSVELGEADIKENVSEEYLKLIDHALKEAGLELMEDKNDRIIEKIKQAVHQMIYSMDEMPKTSFSDYISMKININYTTISNLFSGNQGITIEKYVISQKIEYVKELLVYDKISLGDIAFKLQYSSVAHLSNQFKKVTGLTPSFFRQIRIDEKHKI
jgi:AraC-like DNA-binding protein